MQKFVIRPVSSGEIPAILKLWKRAGLMYRPRGRDSVKCLREQRRCNPDLFIGAFGEGGLIGVSIVTDDGRKGWINRLAVLPGVRRKGIATGLVGASEKALRRRGRKMFCTHIVKGNTESLELFKRLGYKVETEILYLTKRESESY